MNTQHANRHIAWAGAALMAVLWAPALAKSPVTAVQVTGSVAHPGAIALDALPQVTFSGSFQAMGAARTHSWRGPRLLDVLNKAGITDAPGKKTHLRHTILATGADGYAVAVSLGEIDPIAEGKQVVVALSQDGTPLPTPRLVVPGDKHAARGVHNLVTLSVQ